MSYLDCDSRAVRLASPKGVRSDELPHHWAGIGACSGRVSSSAGAEALRQRTDAGASGEAIEGRGCCTVQRNAYGVLPDAGGLDAGGVVIPR